ncbi:glycoside hydrolase family 9 protein [Luteolibacter sp. LG18]|uniref:glycoside hydrolase family 9 protein n=1 Tax=Luteolibacter sp. LG18 TaxID=2819286 RepID=UPI002B2CF882|nr:hypothetical protein llg_42860 [Luteolibacter sp. LG18]
MKRGLFHPLFCFPALAVAISALCHGSDAFDAIDGLAGELPLPGLNAARLLAPDLIELGRINTQPQGGPPDSWNFIATNGTFTPPTGFEVRVAGVVQPANVLSFRRRPLYAPLAIRDLRIDNRLYISLSSPVPDGAVITLSTNGWEGAGMVSYEIPATLLRRSPAIHVNQEGYGTDAPKQARVGYFLGNAGELPVPATTFSLVDTADQTVFTGPLAARPDTGYLYTPAPYQQVKLADFSPFTAPGVYRVMVPGLGTSLPFRIGDGLLMNFTRTYATGLYQQRCGQAVDLPFSRHTHPACHTAPASVPVPQSSFANTWSFIAAGNNDYANNPRHTAPRLANQAAQLYPFVRTGPLDVSGGHHDAGDYSKYTINSAQLIHHLVFAADSLPDVGTLDNLGIPESSDGKSDLLQEAKVEADFLAKMQDDDGGFFFLVYPRDRKYESNILPQNGDPQVVWPKNTSATAAAVGALAEIGSSPLFRQQYPAEATLYLQKATAGWNFLLSAIATYGKDGSYQKITHYGDVFMHDDELAWAAAAMFAATGNTTCHTKLLAWYDPSSPATRRWGWWRLFEGYGCAARTYAFAVRSGRRTTAEMDPSYLAKCEAEITAAAADARDRASKCAYGSSFELESKRQRTAGWYFSSDRAFDLAAGQQISPQAGNAEAAMSNINYELGCNPVNISYLAGAGQRQQREIVHQYAQNDWRTLPPTGLPVGNIQTGFAYLGNYGYDLSNLTYPPDGAATAPYPYYDRWADTYNTTTEFVCPQLARALAGLSSWAAPTPAAGSAWSSAAASLVLPSGYLPVGQPLAVTLSCPGVDLSEARVTWESSDQEPWIGGSSWTFTPVAVGSHTIEAEAALPDGRRVRAAATFSTRAANGGTEFTSDANTLALYHFNGNYQDSSNSGYHLTPAGNTQRVSTNTGWMAAPCGEVVRFSGLGDALTATLPDSAVSPGSSTTPLTLEAWIYPRAYKAWSVGNYPVISLYQQWDSSLEVVDNKWNSPGVPLVRTGSATILSSAQWQGAVTPGTWQLLRITRDANSTYNCWINNVLVSTVTSPPNNTRTNAWTLTLGNIDADMDEVRVSNVVR